MDFYAIEKENPSAALKVLEEIRAACRRAGEDPGQCERRPDLGPDVRSRIVHRYPFRIYFRPAVPTAGFRVEVIRILRQQQDVGAAFGDLPPG